jgi:hypothetical protein
MVKKLSAQPTLEKSTSAKKLLNVEEFEKDLKCFLKSDSYSSSKVFAQLCATDVSGNEVVFDLTVENNGVDVYIRLMRQDNIRLYDPSVAFHQTAFIKKLHHRAYQRLIPGRFIVKWEYRLVY